MTCALQQKSRHNKNWLHKRIGFRVAVLCVCISFHIVEKTERQPERRNINVYICEIVVTHTHQTLIQTVGLEHRFECLWCFYCSVPIMAFFSLLLLWLFISFISFSKSKCAEACIKVKCSDDLAMVYFNETWKYKREHENRWLFELKLTHTHNLLLQ